MSKLLVVILVVLSFAGGWYARGIFFVPTSQSPLSMPLPFPESSRSTLSNRGDSLSTTAPYDETPDLTVSQADASTSLKSSQKAAPELSIKVLIAEGKYTDAIALMQNLDDRRFLEAKLDIQDHLTMLMDNRQNDSFIELTDAYLAVYYDDIDLLLLLAQFNQRMELFSEAVSIYLLAKEYAYSMENANKVRHAYDTFMKEVDAYLTEKSERYLLSQLYAQADFVELLNATQKLRYAQVLLDNGEYYLAKSVLEPMLDNTAIGKRARGMLASLNPEDDTAGDEEVASAYKHNVELKKRGNQYLVDISLGGGTENIVLIDTGASITTLSRAAFESVRGDINADFRGVRMFSTANGVTKGEMYRVSEFMMADVRLQNVEIAVLESDMGRGIDGLLGMNILGRFRFQLDQDGNQLLLQRRY